MGVTIPWLSEADLRSRARAFLANHHSAGTLPVPIELIIERQGIDIVPVPGLLNPQGRGINGYLCADASTLYIDEGLYHNNENRYLFTLAHEVSHLELHPTHFRAFATFADWLAFHRSLPPDAIASAEWQANTLAGLILVPDALLLSIANTYFQRAASQVLSAAPNFDLTTDAFWDYVTLEVAAHLHVSRETATIRLKADGIWGKKL